MTFAIPTLFIKKPLYLTNGQDAQKIVDAKNSAVLIKWRNFLVIADHCTDEGMWRLQYAIPNRTICEVVDELNRKTEYICIKKQRGQIVNGKLYDSAHVRINNYKDLDLCIYTCTGKEIGNATEVWLTFWRKK